MPRLRHSYSNGEDVIVADGPIPMALNRMSHAQLIQDLMGYLRLSSRYLYTGNHLNGTLVNKTIQEILTYLQISNFVDFNRLLNYLLEAQLQLECEERAIKTSQELLLALPIEERTAEVAMGIEIIRSSISYLISHMPVESIQTLLEDPGLPQSLRAELIKKYAEFNYFAQFSSNEM